MLSSNQGNHTCVILVTLVILAEEFFPEFRLEADSAYFVRACRDLSTTEQDEVKREFAEMLNEQGICMKRQTKVCDVRNIGIICGQTTRRRKRDVSSGEEGEEEEVDQVHIQLDVAAHKMTDKLSECDSICNMLRIPQRRCGALCFPTYKRFLRAAVMYSRRQLQMLYATPQQVGFTAAHRQFEAKENGLITSDLKTNCEEGMMSDGELCGRFISQCSCYIYLYILRSNSIFKTLLLPEPNDLS